MVVFFAIDGSKIINWLWFWVFFFFFSVSPIDEHIFHQNRTWFETGAWIQFNYGNWLPVTSSLKFLSSFLPRLEGVKIFPCLTTFSVSCFWFSIGEKIGRNFVSLSWYMPWQRDWSLHIFLVCDEIDVRTTCTEGFLMDRICLKLELPTSTCLTRLVWNSKMIRFKLSVR